MKRAFLPALLVVSLIGCTDPTPTSGPAARPDWTLIAADGVSIGEMALRSWCDPGTTLDDVKSSSEGTLNSLRLAAAKVRSAGVATKEDGVSPAHDELVALAEFAAAVHHLANITTNDGFIRPDDSPTQLEHMNLTQSTIIFSGLTEQEKDEMRAGKDVSQYKSRVLEQVLQRQRTSVDAAVAGVTGKQQAISKRSDEGSGDGQTLTVDPAVVANATNCVRSMVDKRMAAN